MRARQNMSINTIVLPVCLSRGRIICCAAAGKLALRLRSNCGGEAPARCRAVLLRLTASKAQKKPVPCGKFATLPRTYCPANIFSAKNDGFSRFCDTPAHMPTQTQFLMQNRLEYPREHLLTGRAAQKLARLSVRASACSFFKVFVRRFIGQPFNCLHKFFKGVCFFAAEQRPPARKSFSAREVETMLLNSFEY